MKKYVEVDIKKIFLTPPNTMSERLMLIATLCVTFMLLFRPIQFSTIKPLEAILISGLASVSVSWGWIVLLRSLFRKSQYSKD